jgi:hypothetical protein
MSATVDLLSKRTRQLFLDIAVQLSLREVDQAFLAEDIERNEHHQSGLSSQRRQRASEYLSTVDYTDPVQVKGALNAMASGVANVERQAQGLSGLMEEQFKQTLAVFFKSLAKDGYEYVADAQEIRPVASSPILAATKALAERFDMSVLKDQVALIHEKSDTNPGLAIGTSKNLVETVCKTILTERRVAFNRDDGVIDLVNKVRGELQLMPHNIPDDAKGVQAIKKVLGSLGTVVQGIAELRNDYGDGHGPEARRKGGLEPRHAHLASGAASALAVFLWQTHLYRVAPTAKP